MKAVRLVACVMGLLLATAVLALGSDIYIAQNSAGANSGADCADAHSAAWFNTAANWGTSITQIVPGDTVHLCGTFTGTPGQTMLTVQGSGAAGAPITILFESGAVLVAPYWGGASAGAINIVGQSYITVDGGSNGVIQNTDNGTARTYQQTSIGIYISGSSHIDLRNLTISNIYMNGGSNSAATDTGGQGTADITLSGSNNSIFVHNNVLNNARVGLNYGYSGTVSDIEVYNNYISDHCWGIAIGASSGTPTITNVRIHDNEVTDWTNWWYPSTTYHTDGIILWQTQGGTFAPWVYNNYIHGDLGGPSATAFIFCTYGITQTGATTSSQCRIFNNVLVQTAAHGTVIWVQQVTGPTYILNNTLVDVSTDTATGIMISGLNGSVVENNILEYGGTTMGGYDSPATSVLSNSDYNDWYMINGGGANTRFGLGGFQNLATWQSNTGYDMHSITGNPLLNSNYMLSSGSPAIGSGVNLASLAQSLGIPLATDKAGGARPSTGAWDMGAYQYSTTSAPAAPSGLTATVH